jgi:hypothetical protein
MPLGGRRVQKEDGKIWKFWWNSWWNGCIAPNIWK